MMYRKLFHLAERRSPGLPGHPGANGVTGEVNQYGYLIRVKKTIPCRFIAHSSSPLIITGVTRIITSVSATHPFRSEFTQKRDISK